MNHKRVARLMRAVGIEGVRLRRRVRTTVPAADTGSVPDRLGRDFTATEPNTRYAGDITYLPLADGSNLYLSTVLDLYSARLVGWEIREHMRTELVERALRKAAAVRGGLAGALFHSDHGTQYESAAFAECCEQLGVARSMGTVGSSADNARVESFNATLKREVLQGRKHWANAIEARLEVESWILRYNAVRRHSSLGNIAPIEYEQQRATIPAAV